MKKSIFVIGLLSGISLSAQFRVNVKMPSSYQAKEAILYTLDGSKDIISSREVRNSDGWNFKVDKAYQGMMKIYFPETNQSVSLISENKDVKMELKASGAKITDVAYMDEANKTMEAVQDLQKKNELIFPALVQIKEYYKPDSDFGTALSKEMERLGKNQTVRADQHPFVAFYSLNYNKFLVEQSTSPKPTQKEIVQFISGSGEMLETSSLLRPLLVAYLNNGGNANVDASVSELLNAVNVETPRGQTVLSELIDIFDAYGMTDQKQKYLTEAKNLKCTINNRLSSTLKVNADTELGAKFPDYKFESVSNTTAKNLYGIKASKKVIVFWSSTCSHCEKEIPQFIEKYKTLQAQNIQIVGISLDVDKDSYTKRIAAFPWINTTEFRGWNSTFIETYNIQATPTYFILDFDNKIISKPNHIQDVFNFLNVK